MNNEELTNLVDVWTLEDLDYKQKLSVIGAVTNLLIERRDDDIDNILTKLKNESKLKFINLLCLCSSHQQLFNEDGSFYGSQLQFILPVIFYSTNRTENPKVVKEVHGMTIRSYAQTLMDTLDFDDIEFNFLPNLIESDKFSISYSSIFHFNDDFNSSNQTPLNYKIETDKPILYFIYCRAVMPGKADIYTNEIEERFANPSEFRSKALLLEKQYKSYAKLNNFDLDVFVGNPSTVPHALSNVYGDLFIAEVLMRLSYCCDKEQFSEMIAEVSVYEDKTYILVYEDNRCFFVYVTTDEAFQDLSGGCRFDGLYFQKVLKEQGFKRVMLSNRDFGSDFDDIMGRKLMSF